MIIRYRHALSLYIPIKDNIVQAVPVHFPKRAMRLIGRGESTLKRLRP